MEKIKHIIAKKLANQCTAEEASALTHWMDASVQNRALYKQYKKAWDYTAASSSPNPSFDSQKAWNQLQSRIAHYENRDVVFKVNRRPKIRVMPVLVRIAAVLVIAVAGWFMFQQGGSQPEMIKVTAESVKDDMLRLPDGTQVFLNQGTQLHYNSEFAQSHRHIDFEGEAIFEVARDAGQAFIISTERLGIEVLGTRFHLLAKKDEKDVKLHLQSGKVKVYSLDDQGQAVEQLLLNAGEMLHFDKETAVMSRGEIVNENYQAWKTGVLEFNNAPLTEVIEALESTYQLEFVSKHDCSNFLLTARFDNETPEAILQTLEFVFSLNITEKDGQYIIQ